MDYDYDVAIVGAGPIGSTLAYELAKKKYKIAIFEKKKEIGIPLQCAGILSKKIKEINDLPKTVILNEVKGAYLYSKNYKLKVEKDENEAIIIDRIAYDQYLANRAINSGVKLYKVCKAIAINPEKGIIKFQNNKEITAKIIVAADGSKSFISDLFNKEFNYFNASQYLIKTNNDLYIDSLNNRDSLTNIDSLGNIDSLNDGDSSSNTNSFNNKENIENEDYVELFTLSKILPGFIWSIPSSNNSYRVGLFSNNSYKEQKEILNDFVNNNEKFKDFEIYEKYHGKIPIFDKKKKLIYKSVILIGDAASQLKPTTGGGLIIGFDAVKIAKKAIIHSLNTNDLSKLEKYEKDFKKKYSRELSIQSKVQQTLEILSDEDLDYMFKKLKEKNGEEIISKYGDMDQQSILVKEFIKSGLIFSIIPKIFFKKLIAIWNLNKN